MVRQKTSSESISHWRRGVVFSDGGRKRLVLIKAQPYVALEKKKDRKKEKRKSFNLWRSFRLLQSPSPLPDNLLNLNVMRPAAFKHAGKWREGGSGMRGFSVINKRTLWYVRPRRANAFRAGPFSWRIYILIRRAVIARAYCRDGFKLRATETEGGGGEERREEGQRGQKRRDRKDICIVFSSCFRRSPPPTEPTNVHPTFMPVKQLELKHRGSDGEKLGGREAERSLPMWLTFCFSLL